MKIILILIFLLAIFLRFIYFPQNIYFGFDQARDAFMSQEILEGDLKVVGPPTGVEGWFHGPLYYYIYAPIYQISSGNPEYVAAFLRISNALGILLVFLIGLVIFNKWVGVISAFLFAVSFEQTQYALYFNHPSLAVLTVILFYLGLSLLIFKKKQKGLIVALLGLGLSLQFEFVLIYLFLIFVLILFLFRKSIPKINKQNIILAITFFLFSTLTFILVEIKFNFRSVSIFLSLVSSTKSNQYEINKILGNIYLISQRLINDNIISNSIGIILIGLLIILIFKSPNIRLKLLFLLIWFISGILPFLNNKSSTPLYYYSVGASVSLLIFYAFIIQKIFTRNKIIALVLLIIPVISNIYLITTNNKYGSIATINVQSGMLLSDEKKVIDYIYNNSLGNPFAVNAISMPLNINTTWSYLFEWYGMQKYGFIPIWGGDTASGYPGNLKIVSSRSTLPKHQFLIVEPSRGIRPALIENMLREENYFTKIIREERIGEFIVQTRETGIQ